MRKGMTQVICGEGTERTEMALGKAITEIARKRKVIIIHFLKGMAREETGEWLKQLEPELKSFLFEKQNGSLEESGEEQKTEDQMDIQNGLNFARKVLTTGECDMLILDEFLEILNQNMIEEEDWRSLLSLREEALDLILTGEMCPESLAECVDRVTRIKHVG